VEIIFLGCLAETPSSLPPLSLLQATKVVVAIKAKNIAIFAEIDHTKAAKKSQENLLPATVLVVGNPKVGTRLMQENPKVAIELPLKVLVYEENGIVQVRYKFVSLLVSDYKLEKVEQITQKIDIAMGKIIAESVMK